MENASRPLAEYDHLELRGSADHWQAFVKGKNARVIDIYLACQRANASLHELARSLGLTEEEIKEAVRYCEWHRDRLNQELGLPSREGKGSPLRSAAYRLARVLVPAILFVFGVMISIAFKGLFSIAVGILCFILFLRFANEIPIFGWAWVKVFGRQDLWEWLRMTIAPVAIGIVGTTVTTTINRYQNQANIERSRNDLVSAYLSAYQPDKELYARAMSLVEARATEARTLSPQESKNTPSLSCATRPDSNWLSIHARSTLSQISSLEPPRDTGKTAQKRPILEFLHLSGLVRRGSNIVDLVHADLTDSSLTWADLSDSCLRQVKFIDYPATPELASDLRFARLDGSDLTGANLKRANLRYANLRGVDLRRSASLSRADLRGADLEGAMIDGTTGLYGAIVNTAVISVDSHKGNWWYPLICNRSVQDALEWTVLCVDSVDWTDIQPTRLPLFVDQAGVGRQVVCPVGRSCGYEDASGRFVVLSTPKGEPKIRIDNRVPTL